MLFVAVSLVGLASASQASIVSTSGQVFQIAPPPSLQMGVFTNNHAAFAIDEKQNVLFNGLVDRLNPALMTNYTGASVLTAPLSSLVDSHIIHFDDTGVPSGANVVGTVTFSRPIIALIYTSVRLDQSDAQLGNIGTTVYPFGTANRGFATAFGTLDKVRLLSPDTVEITVGQSLDQIRVLTEAVPSPGSLALVPAAGLLATRRRRG